jgi:hypothetical protein
MENLIKNSDLVVVAIPTLSLNDKIIRIANAHKPKEMQIMQDMAVYDEYPEAGIIDIADSLDSILNPSRIADIWVNNEARGWEVPFYDPDLDVSERAEHVKAGRGCERWLFCSGC